jgi:hypothetical protein
VSKILAAIRGEPAVIAYALNAAVVLAVSFGLHLSHDQEAAVATIVAAVLSGFAAVATRPVVVSAVTGALSTALAAAAAFGLHLTAGQLGTLVTVVSLVLAHVLRANVSPAGARSPG